MTELKTQVANTLPFDITLKLNDYFKFKAGVDHNLDLDSMSFELKSQYAVEFLELQFRIEDWPVVSSETLPDGGWEDCIRVEQPFVTRLGKNQVKRGPRLAGVIETLVKVRHTSGRHVKLSVQDLRIKHNNVKVSIRAESFGLRLTEVAAEAAAV